MGATNVQAKDIQTLETKLDLRGVRKTTETFGDYWLDGKLQFRVKMPNVHGGKQGGISTGLLKSCADSVGLNLRDYRSLVDCDLTADEFAKRVREGAAGRAARRR